jgi:hypothetical protein
VGRIFVFGEVTGDTEILAEVGAEVIEDVRLTENGLPSVKAMFETASERSNADLLMFTNADMIYLPSFFSEVSKCRSLLGDGFLLVGSRMDFDCERDFDFATENSVTEFQHFAKSTGNEPPPTPGLRRERSRWVEKANS